MKFILLMALLSFVLLFLIGDMLLMFGDTVRYIDEGTYVCCYSIGIGIAIVLGLSALKQYRHHLALSIAEDPVYRTFAVSSPQEMMKVVGNALSSLNIAYRRLDPPAPAYTDAKRFPKHIRGMFRVSDPDLAIVVYTGAARADGSFRSDVVVGPVTQENLSQLSDILRAIDERRNEGRPDLNVRWG